GRRGTGRATGARRRQAACSHAWCGGGSVLKSRSREERGRPERVLVVEDDADPRGMLVSVIADEGFEPIPALDGQHARRTARAIEPRAIVLDLGLPDLDGEAFAR